MPLPDFTNVIRSNGLGINGDSFENVLAVIGCCSLGTAGDIVALSDLEEVAGALGTGPLADFVADALGARAPLVLACRAESVTGANGEVTEEKTGDGTVTPSGVPLDDYDVVIEILSDGVLNAATFRYSLDGGDTWSDAQTVPTDGVYEIPNTGITVTFACTEGFDDGDQFEWAAADTGMTLATMNAAIEALRASSQRFSLLGVAGESLSPAWTALDGKAELFAGDHKFLRVICEGPAANEDETVAEWVDMCLEDADGFASNRVGPVAARGLIIDQLTGAQVERNLAGIYAGRLCALSSVHTSPAEVAQGSVSNIVELRPAGLTEAQITQLDAARYVTFRTISDLDGYYVTNGRLMAATTSDFQYIELGRVMDKAARLSRIAGLQLLQGDADDRGQAALKNVMKGPLRRMRQTGEITDFEVVIPAGQDVLASGRLSTKVRIQPVGKLRWIENDIGFYNPYSG